MLCNRWMNIRIFSLSLRKFFISFHSRFWEKNFQILFAFFSDLKKKTLFFFCLRIDNEKTPKMTLRADPLWRIEKRLLCFESRLKTVEQIDKNVIAIAAAFNAIDTHIPRKAVCAHSRYFISLYFPPPPLPSSQKNSSYRLHESDCHIDSPTPIYPCSHLLS